MTDTPMTERTQATASTAADEGKHVAGVAQGEAAKVATEAKTQAKSLASEAQTQVATQVTDQTRQQRDKLVGTLGMLSDDLGRMADSSEGGLASDVAREIAGHAQSLTSYLDGREPGEMLEDVRDLARRRPGTFLVGALVAGVVAGRVARGVKDAQSTTSTSTAPTTTVSGLEQGPPASAISPVPAGTIPPPPSDYAPGTPGTPPVTPATTAVPPPYDPPPYDPSPTQAFDPLGPVDPPPSGPPSYSQGPLPGGSS